MSVEKVLSRVPFYVEQASYCISFHERRTCLSCTDEGCPRLDEAAELLADYRAQRTERYGRTGSS
ncbi:hypothetical protein EAD89_26105 [Micromonospora sp. BL4]|uniref:hypothetical protein n=1 Tax=Micromonospora sp. BL4 TaxID=2478710 RepID=UPI000F17463E|nr:hypothetical protein [Micromonospora sp. BL4]RLP84402.1 hypothetical protein EAD89_26105 [Micromonospora sp. BL4]